MPEPFLLPCQSARILIIVQSSLVWMPAGSQALACSDLSHASQPEPGQLETRLEQNA